MKKKILISVMTICVVAGLAVGGMHAYFSDTETSAPNTFTAGTIDLMVNDQNPWTSAAVTTELEDLKPCETGSVTITLNNVGTNPMDVWKKLTVTATSGGTASYPSGDPVASSEPEWEECGGADYVEECDIDGVIRYSMQTSTDGGATWTDAITEDEDFTISAGSHQLNGKTNAVEEQYIYLGEMAPGDVWTITQGYHMDKDTGNWAQGDTMTFTIEFYAQQTVGEAPAPGTELSGHGKPLL